MGTMFNPAHPGEVLREYLPANLTIGQVADALGVSRQAISAVLNGRANITATMALRLSIALGTTPEFWINMQSQYDLWQAQQNPPKEVHRLAEAC
ncbi:MAG: HigA family addiction module antidote protein [Pseudomonadota bacterium]|nr:HigA family addiction module antidote protein [Pseudomonadota bacterium]